MSASKNTELYEYRFDPLDRWVGSSSVDRGTTKRFNQRNQVATEMNDRGQTCVVRCVHQLLAQHCPDGSTLLLATDRQGSVMSDWSIHLYVSKGYTPYGYLHDSNVQSSLLGYNSEWRDALTGYYLLGTGSRVYNPVLMRFCSPDILSPFGAGGVNAYAYCSGDPLNWQDPSGHVRLPVKLTSLLALFSAANPEQMPKAVAKAKETVTLASQALVGSNNVPDYTSPGRQIIRNATSKQPLTQTFSRALSLVNHNLASHGIPLDRAAGSHYGALVKSVERGEIHNSTAHFKAAHHWMTKTFGPERVVGVTFNVGGGFLAGAHDAKAVKTGNAIRGL